MHYFALLAPFALACLRGLCPTSLPATQLITAGSSTRLLACFAFAKMVLRNPFFLVASGTGSSDCSNRCTDGGRVVGAGTSLLGLGEERQIGIVKQTAKTRSDNQIS